MNDEQRDTVARQRPGLWQRCLDNLAKLRSGLEDLGEIEAKELQQDVRSSGFDPVSECADRSRVRLCGTLRTVTLSPRGGETPALEAELYDGSGRVTVVWLGRRRIGGIEPGRKIVVSGRISVHDDELVMYNPRYELRPVVGQ